MSAVDATSPVRPQVLDHLVALVRHRVAPALGHDPARRSEPQLASVVPQPDTEVLQCRERVPRLASQSPPSGGVGAAHRTSRYRRWNRFSVGTTSTSRNPASSTVPTNRRGPHHEAGPGRGLLRHPGGQAVQHAGCVVKAFEVGARDGEPIGDLGIHDEDAAFGAHNLPAAREDIDRPRHLVEGVQQADQVDSRPPAVAAPTGNVHRPRTRPARRPGQRRRRSSTQSMAAASRSNPTTENGAPVAVATDATPAGAATDVGDISRLACSRSCTHRPARPDQPGKYCRKVTVEPAWPSCRSASYSSARHLLRLHTPGAAGAACGRSRRGGQYRGTRRCGSRLSRRVSAFHVRVWQRVSTYVGRLRRIVHGEHPDAACCSSHSRA